MEPEPGGCICGDVRFEVTAPPTRVTICHCRWCQRATGSAFMVEPIFDLAALSVTRGTPALYEHRSTGSGKLLHVHFCRRCGTKLYLTLERFPGVAGIYAGCFDRPDWIAVQPHEARHIFCEAARPETLLPEGAQAFAGHSRAADDTMLAPLVVGGTMPARAVFAPPPGVAGPGDGA